ncbi:MAG TPA: hypothetical protein VFN56_03925 [Candidatus Saccharimonadales bacterium]|nr:hypothetical protein [Candidatus Saccharimonadales bacterium]
MEGERFYVHVGVYVAEQRVVNFILLKQRVAAYNHGSIGGRKQTIQRIAAWAQRVRLPDNPYLRTLYVFTIINWIGGTAYGMYYGIFLYRHTMSLHVLALDGVCSGLGAYLGYLLGVRVVRRRGYGTTIKISFGLMAAVAVCTALLTQHIAAWYLGMAILRALPGGLYSAVADVIMLRDIDSPARGRVLHSTLAIEYMAGVVLPTLIGSLIRWSHGYRLAFLLSGAIYVSALVIPVRLPKPVLYCDVRAVMGMFKRPLYVPHIVNRMVGAGFNQLNAFALTIVPFLMFKNELKLGLVTSAMALIAGCVSLGVKRIRSRSQLHVGYAAYVVRFIGTSIFVSVWTAPFLVAWQLLNKLVTPVHDPLQQSLDIQNDQLILGKSVKDAALSMNVLNNTLLLIGSSAGYGLFFLIAHGGGSQRSILKLLLLSFAAWRFLNLTISAGINRQAQLRGDGAAWLNDGPAVFPLLLKSISGKMWRVRFVVTR